MVVLEMVILGTVGVKGLVGGQSFVQYFYALCLAGGQSFVQYFSHQVELIG
jgi:hypothetical protein